MNLRSRLFPILGMGIIAAAILAAIVSLSIGEKGPPPPISGSGTVQRLFGGIEQNGPDLGDPNAPVSISIFNDLQCGECATYEVSTVPRLTEDLVRSKQAKLTFRNFSIGPTDTTLSQYAATAAGLQDFEWQYAYLVFLNIDDVKTSGVSQHFLDGVAAAIPDPQWDAEKWQSDLDSPQVKARVESDAKLAVDLRLTAEPAVVVDGPGGTKQLENSPSVTEIEAAVREVD